MCDKDNKLPSYAGNMSSEQLYQVLQILVPHCAMLCLSFSWQKVSGTRHRPNLVAKPKLTCMLRRAFIKGTRVQ